ncbi:hypothetical protein B9G53_07795 [Pseudanabaena sp. SR411]|nr:hypothetical protein B9G53_07795 [Pseudanabaena sp. SR411]
MFLLINAISLTYIATQEITRTNQNPRDEWRREAPPLISWVAMAMSIFCRFIVLFATTVKIKKCEK